VKTTEFSTLIDIGLGAVECGPLINMGMYSFPSN